MMRVRILLYANSTAKPNTVYVLQCMKCNSKYMGLTTILGIRINNHRSAIVHHKNFKVSRHYVQNNHTKADMAVGIFEHQPNLSITELRLWKAFWIHKLNTQAWTKKMNVRNN